MERVNQQAKQGQVMADLREGLTTAWTKHSSHKSNSKSRRTLSHREREAKEWPKIARLSRDFHRT